MSDGPREVKKMNKKVLVMAVALMSAAMLAVPVMAKTKTLETNTEYVKAWGTTAVDVPGHPMFIVLGQHFKQSNYFPGSADRIQFVMPGVQNTPRLEDNPWRYAFSRELGGPTSNIILTGRDTIQVLRMNDALKVYWTEPIMLTTGVVIPPAILMFRADGDALPPLTQTGNIGGWTYTYELTERYNAKVTFDCPDWGYFGPVGTTGNPPGLTLEGTGTWAPP